MKYILLPRFADGLEKLSSEVQKRFWKQLRFLLHNLRHPSLHAKKYDETKGIWQARIDKYYRFYFNIENDTYILLYVKKHND